MISAARVIGMVGLANREGGYSEEEQETAVALATATVEALERKRAEIALRESEQRWATTLPGWTPLFAPIPGPPAA